jgi:predicted dehydrogenase
MTHFRTAILGCGSFAHKHAGILASLADRVELVAFCDRNQWKAADFAVRYTAGRAAVFDNHEALLAKVPLDLLVIALPPHGHGDEVELAAERGIHLLIEKPIALTSEHAWRMVAAVERAGVKSQVGFMYRFGEAIERLKSMIESGEAGRPGLISGRYFCNALHAPWWRDREQSGGQLFEQAVHVIDLMRYLFGEPVAAFSKQANLFHRETPGYTVEDVSATIYTFAGGALGVLYATNQAIPGRWINDYRVVAERVTADFANANNATIHLTGGSGQEALVVASQRDVYFAQMLDLLAAIATGSETRTPIREGAMTLDMALAAQRSAETGAEVFLA